MAHATVTWWLGTREPSSQALPEGGDGDKKEAEKASTENQNVCLVQCALLSKMACALKQCEKSNFYVFPLSCSLLEIYSICSYCSLCQLYFIFTLLLFTFCFFVLF